MQSQLDAVLIDQYNALFDLQTKVQEEEEFEEEEYDDQASSITWDGTVDRNGIPATRNSTGKWPAGIIILCKLSHISNNISLQFPLLISLLFSNVFLFLTVFFFF